MLCADLVLETTNARTLVNCINYRGGMNHHHVCLIVSCKSGTVLTFSSNIQLPKRSIHAEEAAISRFRRMVCDGKVKRQDIRKGVRLVSLRVSPQGNLRMARPCDRCSALIKKCGVVRYVEWSTNDGAIVGDMV